MDDTPSLLSEWYAKSFMDATSKFHMRESYVIKSQSRYPDTPMYMEALSGKNADE